MSDQRHRIQVDHSEREAPLLELLRRSGDFDVRIVRLTAGDYLINDQVLIERKTIATLQRHWSTVVCFRRRLAWPETAVAP